MLSELHPEDAWLPLASPTCSISSSGKINKTHFLLGWDVEVCPSVQAAQASSYLGGGNSPFHLSKLTLKDKDNDNEGAESS